MNILLAHDGSEHADRALERAAELAEKFDASLSVIVVATGLDTISETLSFDMHDAVEEVILKDAEIALKKAVDWLSSKGIKAESILVRGRPQDRILATAESMCADMIVIGSRGRHGVEKFFLGSVSSEVAEHAQCDVLIVK